MSAPGIVANGPSVAVPLGAQVALLAPLPIITKTGVGLLLTPSSSVYWTVYPPGSSVGIDTPRVQLSHCLVILSACTASTTISLAGTAVDGVYTVVAHYLGDDLAASSNGTTSFLLSAG